MIIKISSMGISLKVAVKKRPLELDFSSPEYPRQEEFQAHSALARPAIGGKRKGCHDH